MHDAVQLVREGNATVDQAALTLALCVLGRECAIRTEQGHDLEAQVLAEAARLIGERTERQRTLVDLDA